LLLVYSFYIFDFFDLASWFIGCTTLLDFLDLASLSSYNKIADFLDFTSRTQLYSLFPIGHLHYDF